MTQTVKKPMVLRAEKLNAWLNRRSVWFVEGVVAVVGVGAWF